MKEPVQHEGHPASVELWNPVNEKLWDISTVENTHLQPGSCARSGLSFLTKVLIYKNVVIAFTQMQVGLTIILAPQYCRVQRCKSVISQLLHNQQHLFLTPT